MKHLIAFTFGLLLASLAQAQTFQLNGTLYYAMPQIAAGNLLCNSTGSTATYPLSDPLAFEKLFGPPSNAMSADKAMTHSAVYRCVFLIAGATALLGNHELRLLNYRRTGDKKYAKETDLDTFEKLRPADWKFLEAMPLTFEEPELDTVFVHGGFLPDTPWRKQPAEVVTRIQVVDKDGHPAKRSAAPGAFQSSR